MPTTLSNPSSYLTELKIEPLTFLSRGERDIILLTNWLVATLVFIETEGLGQARRFVEIFGGVQLNNQNFFGEISRILFALFVHRRLCLQCSYVAIAHLMKFFFFSVLSRLGNKRTVFWKKKKKKTHRGQKWVGSDERVS